jgi:hypothetical protein
MPKMIEISSGWLEMITEPHHAIVFAEKARFLIHKDHIYEIDSYGLLRDFGENLNFDKKFREDYSERLLNKMELAFIFIRNWLGIIIHFIIHIPWKIRNIIFSIQMILQRVFRKDHVSDIEIPGIYEPFAKFILPRLVRFRNEVKEGVGTYPVDFTEYIESIHLNIETYNAMIASGKIKGGGEEAWGKTLDSMIYAFRYILLSKSHWTIDSSDLIHQMYVDYFGGPETEVSHKYLDIYEEKAQEGFELFGIYFMDLWF